jgi:hypothetical protein
MKNKKGIVVDNLTVLIISIIVVALVFIFLYNTNLNRTLKNLLPSFIFEENGEDEDYTVDDPTYEGKDLIARTNTEMQLIFYGEREVSGFFIDGTKLKYKKGDNKFSLGEIEGKRVLYFGSYLDPFSQEFNNIRMKVDENFWKKLKELDGAVFYSGMFFGDRETSSERHTPYWTEHMEFLDSFENSMKEEKMRADLSQYINYNPSDNSYVINYLYLSPFQERIRILAWPPLDVGRIYPDGSIFLSEEAFKKYEFIYPFGSRKLDFSPSNSFPYETNLRLTPEAHAQLFREVKLLNQ